MPQLYIITFSENFDFLLAKTEILREIFTKYFLQFKWKQVGTARLWVQLIALHSESFLISQPMRKK